MTIMLPHKRKNRHRTSDMEILLHVLCRSGLDPGDTQLSFWYGYTALRGKTEGLVNRPLPNLGPLQIEFFNKM